MTEHHNEIGASDEGRGLDPEDMSPELKHKVHDVVRCHIGNAVDELGGHGEAYDDAPLLADMDVEDRIITVVAMISGLASKPELVQQHLRRYCTNDDGTIGVIEGGKR